MIARWRSLLRRPVLADALLGLVALGVSGAVGVAHAPVAARPDPLPAMGWLLLGVIPIALRRVHLASAVAVTAGYTDLALLAPASWHLIDTGLPLLVITYTVAARLSIRLATWYLALLWVPASCLSAIHALRSDSAFPAIYVLAGDLVTCSVLILVGRVVWNRRAYAEALRERALAAEANQRALAEKAVTEERRRIARELHDVVAHHISVIGVLASGARRTLERDPAATDEALATIEQTGRGVLREMRRLLNLLRSDDTDPEPDASPQPGLAAIAGLVEQFRETGLSVTYLAQGRLDDVDPGVAVTGYRLVQEALTNTLKHANAPSVEVRIVLDEANLALEISDTGRGPSLERESSGLGLIGMRERIGFYGGSLRVGPRPGGGFRVRANIPVEAQ